MANKYKKSKGISPRLMSALLLLSAILLLLRVGNASYPVGLLLLLQGLLAIPLLLLVWLPQPREGILEKSLLSFFALFIALIEVVVPHRVLILLFLIAFPLLILVPCLFHFVFHKAFSRKGAWIVLASLLFSCLLISANSYTFTDGSFFPFWQWLLPISAVIGALAVPLFLRIKLRFWSSVGSFVLTVFFAFMLLECYTCHLNYALDDSEPQSYVLRIEGKDLDLHRKSPDSYEFIFTVEGKPLELEVSRSTYRRFEVGDLYPVRLYKGAFGKSFYT